MDVRQRTRKFIATLITSGARSTCIIFYACLSECAIAQSYSDVFPAYGRFLLPIHAAPSVLKQCSRAVPQGITAFWLPTEKEVEDLEISLFQYLETRHFLDSIRQPESASLPPMIYHRQYVGIERNGTRLIYGNFYRYNDQSWRFEEQSRAVIGCDGSRKYWGIVYDPITRTFDEYEVNGFL